MVEEWEQARDDLKKLKAKELVLRKSICQAMFDSADKFTTSQKLDDGRTLKAIIKINRKIDEAALSSMWNELTATEQAVFKMVPKLQLRLYRQLDDFSLVHEAVTEQPSPTPVLELK